MRQALEERGVSDPSLHVVVVAGPTWAETLVKLEPFEAEELAQLEAWGRERGFGLMFHPAIDRGTPFDTLLRSDAATLASFVEDYPYDVSVSTDNKPFFFDYYKWSSLFRQPDSKGGYFPTIVPMGLKGLFEGILRVGLLAALGILLPVRKQLAAVQRSGLAAIGYFAALGVGFMGVEMALIQRLSIYVGGPTQSLSFSLFVILLFSGIGSFLARSLKLDERKPFLVLAAVIAAVVVLQPLLLDLLVAHTLQLSTPIRLLLAALTVAPMALLLGMPFPTGVRILGQTRPEWVPWGWAINSFFTVLAPSLCILLSMQVGYRTVFYVAALVYVAGFVGYLPLLGAGKER